MAGGRRPDPLKSFKLPGRRLPLRTGGGRKKAKESPADFLARIVRKGGNTPSFCNVIHAVEGDLGLASLYYAVEDEFLRDVMAVHGHCKDAFVKARSIKLARDKDGERVADILKREALDQIAKMPDLPRRERWPVDETERRHAIRDWLIDSEALVLYEGDLAKISEAGTIPMHVLVSMVKSDDRLASIRELGLLVRAERAASRMMELSETSNQPSATDKILKAFGDERWGDRSRVDVRRVGFEAPDEKDVDEDGELVSVLRRVK